MLGKTGENKSKNLLLREFFDLIGFSPSDNTHAYLIEHYDPIFAKHLDKDTGRLVQFFIEPSIVDEVAYVSEVFGFPLYLDLQRNNNFSVKPSEMIISSRKDPLAFEETLKLNRDQFKHQDSHATFIKESPSLRYTNSVEGRLVMFPSFMDKALIIDYFCKPPKLGVNAYYADINSQGEKDLASWLQASTSHIDAPLMRLKKYAEVGITGTEFRQPLHTTATSKFEDAFHAKDFDALKLLVSRRARKDNEHSQLYDLLVTKKYPEAEWLIRALYKTVRAPIMENKESLVYVMLKEKNFEAAKFLQRMGQSFSERSGPRLLGLVHRFLLDDQLDIAEWLLNNNAPLIGNELADFLKEGRADRYDIAQWLINKGANINHAAYHEPILRLLVDAQKYAEAQWLFERGADPDARDNNGTSAIIYFIYCKQKSRTQWFIEHGSDINAPFKKADEIYSLSKDLQVMNPSEKAMLLELGFNPNTINEEGDSLLFSALQKTEYDTARWLVENGAKADLMDNNGYYYLHTAIFKREFVVAEWLLKMGANPNAVYDNGLSILIYQLEVDEDWQGAAWLINNSCVSINDPEVARLIEASGDEGLMRTYATKK